MMRKVLLFSVCFLIVCTFALAGGFKKLAVWTGIIKPGLDPTSNAIVLPNGWKITPAGHPIQLPGDLVMKIIPSADGKTAIVSTAGWHDHSVNVVDVASGKVSQSVNAVKIWSGMAMNPATKTLFISGGGMMPESLAMAANARGVAPEITDKLKQPVLRMSFADGKLAWQNSVDIPGLEGKERFIAGLTNSPDGSLYVININTDTVYRLSGADFKTQISTKVGYRPFAAALDPKGKQLAVSNWGDESVSILDATTLQEITKIKVGSHPNELLFSKDGRLFVANAGSNSVSVIRDNKVVETIKTSLDPKALVGSTPASLALTNDGKRLYVANADNNNVAVIDTANAKESKVIGFIPTDWYPTAVAVSPDGKKLFIGAGKSGMNLRANFPAQTEFKRNAPDPEKPYDYIGATLGGTLSIVDVPDVAQLQAYSTQVKNNFPQPEANVDKAEAEKITKEVFSKIKHVLYIIRENRTYDQVFGDLGKGNGDPNLTIFGEQVTPNAHKLVKDSVIFDNLYCSGEVSEDGHQWSNAAYATDFTQKAWPNSYSRRGEPEADDRLTASPAGYLWDNCRKHGKTYRSYGEFSSFKSTPDTEPIFTGDKGLKDHTSVEWAKLKSGNARDTDKAEIFIKELQAAEKTGEWSNFMVMSLGENHTEGLAAGRFTPIAHVAANDQALGKIVEAVSHSRFWKETAIFVIEDDAQNGPDHVDAHRSCALVLSPYVKRGVVDSTMYTTVSMIRTMEMILGLPPMTQYDQLATPMYNCFTTTATNDAYASLPPQVDLMARNPKNGKGAEISQKLDWSDYDRADPDILNHLLWTAYKGDKPMPASVRSAWWAR